MIQIDYLQDVTIKDVKTQKDITLPTPQMYFAKDFGVLPQEHKDNKDNEELSPFNRNMVTRVTFWIVATAEMVGGEGSIYIKEYDTEAEAVAVYDEIIDAVASGDKIYSFRRSLQYGNSGNSSKD
jgi:hypothetical protein